MTKKLFLLTIACAVAVLPLTMAEAFWSRLTFNIHQDITRDALNRKAVYVYQGAKPGFSETAILAINTQNAAQDDSSGTYSDRDHFDSEDLDRSLQLLQANRARLRAALVGPNINQTYAWQQMGKMLHQIQDFYSHSNWIASGHTDIIHFGALTAISPTGNPPVTPSTGETFCAPDTATLVKNVTDITTGYYPPHYPTPAGKCSHGAITSFDKASAAANCSPSNNGPVSAPDGIARDHPCPVSAKEGTEYVNAYKAAIKETVEFVKAITDELVAANNGPGYCALLGVDSSNPIVLALNNSPCTAGLRISPISPSVVAGSTITLTVSNIDRNGNPLPIPPNIAWSSSDTTIATVIGGVVTGVAGGSAIITATDPVYMVSASTTVVVTTQAPCNGPSCPPPPPPPDSGSVTVALGGDPACNDPVPGLGFGAPPIPGSNYYQGFSAFTGISYPLPYITPNVNSCDLSYVVAGRGLLSYYPQPTGVCENDNLVSTPIQSNNGPLYRLTGTSVITYNYSLQSFGGPNTCTVTTTYN